MLQRITKTMKINGRLMMIKKTEHFVIIKKKTLIDYFKI